MQDLVLDPFRALAVLSRECFYDYYYYYLTWPSITLPIEAPKEAEPLRTHAPLQTSMKMYAAASHQLPSWRRGVAAVATSTPYGIGSLTGQPCVGSTVYASDAMGFLAGVSCHASRTFLCHSIVLFVCVTFSSIGPLKAWALYVAAMSFFVELSLVCITVILLLILVEVKKLVLDLHKVLEHQEVIRDYVVGSKVLLQIMASPSITLAEEEVESARRMDELRGRGTGWQQ